MASVSGTTVQNNIETLLRLSSEAEDATELHRQGDSTARKTVRLVATKLCRFMNAVEGEKGSSNLASTAIRLLQALPFTRREEPDTADKDEFHTLYLEAVDAEALVTAGDSKGNDALEKICANLDTFIQVEKMCGTGIGSLKERSTTLASKALFVINNLRRMQ